MKWSQICWFRHTKADPEYVFLDYTLNQDFRAVNLTGARSTRKNKSDNADILNLGVAESPAYSGRLPITNAKKEDLLELCKRGLIDDVYHGLVWFIGVLAVQVVDYL